MIPEASLCEDPPIVDWILALLDGTPAPPASSLSLDDSFFLRSARRCRSKTSLSLMNSVINLESVEKNSLLLRLESSPK
jgi:hypothetical protein